MKKKLFDKNGIEINVGSTVKTFVYGGCECITKVVGLRKKDDEVVLQHRGLYQKCVNVEVVEKVMVV